MKLPKRVIIIVAIVVVGGAFAAAFPAPQAPHPIKHVSAEWLAAKQVEQRAMMAKLRAAIKRARRGE